jgi:hypothetical protein
VREEEQRRKKNSPKLERRRRNGGELAGEDLISPGNVRERSSNDSVEGGDVGHRRAPAPA